MKVPLQITFKNLEHSDAIAARIRENVDWLEKFHSHIISCRVVVSNTNRRHHKGNLYEIHIDLRVPGAELAISRNPRRAQAHQDVYVAVRDAFSAARRELEDNLRLTRRETKYLARPPQGRITRLVTDEQSYGFIQAEDGREIYFHSNSVINDAYDQLQIGTVVRYAEEAGESGPQASTVEIVGKQGNPLSEVSSASQ